MSQAPRDREGSATGTSSVAFHGQAATLPAISVVLATYNRAETLRRTLDHLARQDLPADQFEVLVIDDGSPDHTASVVEEVRPQVGFTLSYARHENRGPGYTQNRGIERARAPVILLLADDIFLEPWALRAHLERHRAHPEPEAVFLGKVVQSPDLTQTVFLRKWDPFRFHDIEGVDQLPPYRFFAMNISMKRDFVMRHGMYLEHRGRGGASCMEDLELGIRLARHGLTLRYAPEAQASHYHVVSLDTAIVRWYERGLNFGEFRRHAPMPELVVYFHVLDRHTWAEYLRVLRGPNTLRRRETSVVWHLVREAGRRLTLNALTVRYLWRPLLDGAERHAWLAARIKPSVYRAFLYYHFLRGVADARVRWGD